MPIIQNSLYKPPFFLNNGHIQSIYPTFFRKVKGIRYTRERFETPDNDFIDLDWSRIGSDKVAILLHGLEGHSNRSYMRGMVKACNRNGFDAVAMNFRGCSGEPNRLLRSYHHGSSDELHLIVEHVSANNNYKSISLIGLSLGANVIIKYLGENKLPLSPLIQNAAVISAPFDLTSCAWKLADKSNKLYMKHFLDMLHEKIKAKMAIMPDKINDDNYKGIRTFKEFDDRYTAPIHGFKNAEDYWEKCSSKQFIQGIKTPTLVINAMDDPFLTGKCFPYKEAETSDYLYLESPQSGGHNGFIAFNKFGEYWHEKRVMAFISGNYC